MLVDFGDEGSCIDYQGVKNPDERPLAVVVKFRRRKVCEELTSSCFVIVEAVVLN